MNGFASKTITSPAANAKEEWKRRGADHRDLILRNMCKGRTCVAQMFNGLHFRQRHARWIALLAENQEVESCARNPADRTVMPPVIDASARCLVELRNVIQCDEEGVTDKPSSRLPCWLSRCSVAADVGLKRRGALSQRWSLYVAPTTATMAVSGTLSLIQQIEARSGADGGHPGRAIDPGHDFQDQCLAGRGARAAMMIRRYRAVPSRYGSESRRAGAA